jgi:hypothetical protein
VWGVKFYATASLAAALLALPATAGAKPRASVVLTGCQTAVDPELRMAAFEARARRVDGADRMQMRFTLHERGSAVPRWSALSAEGWDAWVTSDPGVAEYRYTREIGRLSAPAGYRAVVRFRWLDAQGVVLARRRAVSAACRQPDLRPNLVVHDVTWRDGRFHVELRNTGRTRAAASQVELMAGQAAYRAPVAPIRPGASRTVAVEAPRCRPGDAGLSAVADVTNAVDERVEDDNGFARNCPAAR